MSAQHTAFVFTAASLLATASHADLTPIFSSYGNEPSHAEILSDEFGGVFVASGNDFTNGDITFFRVDDDDDQSYNLGLWEAEIITTNASAQQGFGTLDEGELIVESGFTSGPGGTDIVFGRFGSQSGTIDAFTNPSLNGGNDHVVTYTFETQDGDFAYLLFFEDLSGLGDRDYNDLVVQVTAVPEPSSLALIALGGLAMIRRRRG